MYIKRSIRFKLIFEDSWRFLLIIGIWSASIVFAHVYLKWTLLSVPIVPLSTIGIAVSLYLGFRSKEAYDRWWEGRKVWGDIINKSRAFSNQVHSLLYDKEGNMVSDDIKKELIYRHIAWVRSLKYQLRSTSRLIPYAKGRMFNHKIVNEDSFDLLKELLTEGEYKKVEAQSNMATQILINQGKALQKLTKEGYLDSIRHSEVNTILTALYDTQGKCERIKKTPFPRPFAYMGQVFTAVFVFLLPLGFFDTFEDESLRHNVSIFAQHEYMLMVIPFTMLLSWIFFMMEKVSDSMEDPFESGVNDLPLTAMVRTIEIDLLESLGEKEIPKPIQPVDDMLH